MFDTNIVIVGNVLTAPEWRRTTNTNTLVANFRVASTARRLDRETGRWVDGNSLRVRVNCWRKLAEGVASSVTVGDPVVVAGRLYTRDWTDGEGNTRTTYEMEAVAVGHDLARGRGQVLPQPADRGDQRRRGRRRPAGQVRGEAGRARSRTREAPTVLRRRRPGRRRADVRRGPGGVPGRLRPGGELSAAAASSPSTPG